MAASSRFGGHIVQGHVDGTATVARAASPGDRWEVVTLHPARRPRPLRRREGVDHRRRRQPHGLGRRRRHLQRLAHPHHARPDDPGHTRASATSSTSRSTSSRSTSSGSSTARAPRASPLAPTRPPPATPAGGPSMNWLERLFEAQLTIGSTPHPVARDRRQRLRVRLRDRWHASPRVGLAGRHRRQRPALHRLLRRGLRQPAAARRSTARPGARSSSSSPASTAGGAGTAASGRNRGADGPAITPRWATIARACRATSGVWVGRGPRRPVDLRDDRRRWPAPALVLLVRRVDLRRLDASRPTRWRAAGTTSGSRGSPSTSSACHCSGTRSSTRRPSSTSSTASSCIYGFIVWLKASREERDPERRAAPRCTA